MYIFKLINLANLYPISRALNFKGELKGGGARELLGGGRNKGELSGRVPHCHFYFVVLLVLLVKRF